MTSKTRRQITAALTMPLPWFAKRFVLRTLLRWEIDPSARIGFSYVEAETVQLAPGSRIGHLNVIRHLESLQLDTGAMIGRLNWVFGTPKNSLFFRGIDRHSSLHLGAQAAVTSRHIIDATARVVIGSFVTIGGYRSQILTHSIRFDEGRQSCSPIHVGDCSFVATGCILLPGTVIGERCIVAAGSVVNIEDGPTLTLLGGVPARRVKDLDPELAYFKRESGVVL